MALFQVSACFRLVKGLRENLGLSLMGEGGRLWWLPVMNSWQFARLSGWRPGGQWMIKGEDIDMDFGIKPSFEIAVKKLFLSWENNDRALLVEAVGEMAQAVAADPSIGIIRPLDHAQFERLPAVKEIRAEIAAAEKEGLRKELFWRFEQEVRFYSQSGEAYMH